MKVTRIEQTIIKKSHAMYKTIEDFSIRSNNFYNYANYIIRQEYINNDSYLNYHETQKMLKTTEPYKHLMSQSSQCILRLLDKNWKSYFKAIEEWNKYPSKFLGQPKIPKYRNKGSKFVWFLKNNQTYIKNERLFFRLRAMKGYGFKTNVKNRLLAVRFVPRNDVFILEIVYEKEIEKKTDFNYNIASIDLGVDNLVTMTNNIGLPPVIIKGKIIKSVNQYYNKRKSKIMKELPKEIYWSRKLDILERKRCCKIKNYMHHNTKFIIKYCKENNIENLVIGHNKKWKHSCNIGKINNQKFINIPFSMIINQLIYKCQDSGINLIITEESYTSGTSFIDDEAPIKKNYDKSRRIKRGLFKSDKGILINSDVNGSLQIMRKVFSNIRNDYEIEGCLNPVIIKNITNCFK